MRHGRSPFSHRVRRLGKRFDEASSPKIRARSKSPSDKTGAEGAIVRSEFDGEKPVSDLRQRIDDRDGAP
ncbi:MAG: hypothetical protein NVSMB14_11230 [Isosphaeraceae bacterium]